MVDDIVLFLEGFWLLKLPGYVLAPAMLVIGTAFLSLHWRRAQHGYTFAALVEHTFALSGWKSKSALIDIVVYVAGRFLPVLSTGFLSVMFAQGLVDLFGAMPDPAAMREPGVGELVAIGLVLVLFLDFGDYVCHYMLHRVPILWEVHKVHHSATFLSPVTSFRNHPLEPQLYSLCHSVTLAPALAVISMVYGIGLMKLLVLMFAINTAVLLATFNHLKHSHLQITLGPLDRVLISPHMHQLHHSARVEHWDKNLGIVFSLWDWLFGTAVRADPRVPVIYGIGRGEAIDAQYSTLYGAYLLPVINMARMAAGKLAPETRPSAEPVAAEEGGVVAGNA